MLTVERLYRDLLTSDVRMVVALPDSLLGPLCRLVTERGEIRYVQTCDEATAVGITAGATLAGVRTLLIMENSGLRRACETLSRFLLSHRLHVVMLISHRGDFGEPNWWGIAHSETMDDHLRTLRIRSKRVSGADQFAGALDDAYAMLGTGQCSVALVADRALLAGAQR
ncbi:hypothetical protein [Nonomuraea sp. SBT364]|uniref:hypothetical protein n=1 Tax=Nonomuraea sp. SBT364 TaxID=1580530 RepID=UPI000ADAD2A3|nr:hypothetical protein [Nonomuraea sp. SBT364]